MARILLLTLIFLFWDVTSRAQNLLDPRTQPQFVNALPIPSVIDARNGGSFTVSITQFEQDLGLKEPISGQPLLTKVWGYNGAFPGPTILTRKNVAIDIQWNNQLINNGALLPHLFPIDTSLMWALKDRQNWKSLGIPLVTHLHGGHTDTESDGLPEAWFTPGFAITGNGFSRTSLHYRNDQEAATIWYHDHALGITRLNVYAGLAGFYLITDDIEQNLQQQNKLPAAPYDIGLAIQDRTFTADGQLYYPVMSAMNGAPENSIMPEAFGNIILVNGKVWPLLEVEARPYRFRILNGSVSRFYNLYFSGNLGFTQIGTDNGLLTAPVTLSNLLLGTGERRDIIIDFSDPKLWGKTLILENNAKTPFPRGTSVDQQTTGRIMAFKVSKPLNTQYPVTQLPAVLRSAISPLQTSLPPRKLILYEGSDDYGRLKVQLGTVDAGIKDYDDPVSEIVQQNSTELWEIYNGTPDAHPVHLHMVHMQLVNRQKFSASFDMETGKPSSIRFLGPARPPGADEAGWKDTYIMYPGEVTRVIATFDLPGKYVWHCHILAHEDHEMMRPYIVQPVNLSISNENRLMPDVENISASPNPFSNYLTVRVQTNKESEIVIQLMDAKGSLIKKVAQVKTKAGVNRYLIDGTALTNGVYFCHVWINGKDVVLKLALQK